MKMDNGRESCTGFLDQSNRRFTEETECALTADKEFRKIEATSRKPIGEAEEVVATTILTDIRAFLCDQRGVVVDQRPQISKWPVGLQQIGVGRIVEPIGPGIQPFTGL